MRAYSMCRVWFLVPWANTHNRTFTYTQIKNYFLSKICLNKFYCILTLFMYFVFFYPKSYVLDTVPGNKNIAMKYMLS